MTYQLLFSLVIILALCVTLMRRRPEDEKLELQDDLPHWEKHLLLSAYKQYQVGNDHRAKYFLDRILAKEGSHSDATVLRSRIAMEEGGAGYAVELINEQLEIQPRCNKLWEAKAAAHYLTRNYDKANRDLTIARNLGSSDQRINRLHGIVFEASGDLQSALDCYQSALAYEPSDQSVKAHIRIIRRKVAKDLQRQKQSLLSTGIESLNSFRDHDFLLGSLR